jgi:hypothetical protein
VGQVNSQQSRAAMSKTSDQRAGYTIEVVERSAGYIIMQVTLARGSRHFCVQPLVRVDARNRGIITSQMAIAHSLAQARVIGQKFKEAVIREGYAVE